MIMFATPWRKRTNSQMRQRIAWDTWPTASLGRCRSCGSQAFLLEKMVVDDIFWNGNQPKGTATTLNMKANRLAAENTQGCLFRPTQEMLSLRTPKGAGHPFLATSVRTVTVLVHTGCVRMKITTQTLFRFL